MKPITIFSLACLIVTLGASYWAWSGLPELDKFPVHWNAQGVPDRFGSKAEVLVALLAMPVSALITILIFSFLPKLEPIKDSGSQKGMLYLWRLGRKDFVVEILL